MVLHLQSQNYTKKIMEKRKYIPEHHEAELVVLCKDGATHKDIKNIFKISTTTVCNVKKKHGLLNGSGFRKSNLTPEQIANIYHRKTVLKELAKTIAKDYDRSETYIWELCAKHTKKLKEQEEKQAKKQANLVRCKCPRCKKIYQMENDNYYGTEPWYRYCDPEFKTCLPVTPVVLSTPMRNNINPDMGAL